MGVSEEDQAVDKKSEILSIYKSYANLDVPLNMPVLQKQVSEFEKLNEDAKRKVFESLKIGYAKEMAKV